MFICSFSLNINANINLQQLPELKLCWFERTPYHYSVSEKVRGIDIDLANEFAKEAGYRFEYIQKNSWADCINSLKSDSVDVLLAAMKNTDRSNYAYFTKEYRILANSFIYLLEEVKFDAIVTEEDIITIAKENNFKLGVAEEFIYTNSKINKAINDPSVKNIFIRYKSEKDLMDALQLNQISGFFSDKLSAKFLIINLNKAKPTKSFNLRNYESLSLMFSKKNISLNIVEKFNDSINKVLVSPAYKHIVESNL